MSGPRLRLFVRICTVTFPGVTLVLLCSVELRPHFAPLLIECFVNTYICIYRLIPGTSCVWAYTWSEVSRNGGGFLACVVDEKSPVYKYSEESAVVFLQKGHEKGAGRKVPMMGQGELVICRALGSALGNNCSKPKCLGLGASQHCLGSINWRETVLLNQYF